MEKSVKELAEFLKGTVEHDNPELKITGVNGLVEAGPQDISFAVPPHVEHCHLSKAGVMVLSPEDPELDGRPVIRVANPRAAFAALLELFPPALGYCLFHFCDYIVSNILTALRNSTFI